MEILKSLWLQIQGMRWSDYLDIILVSYLVYKFLPVFRSTGTIRIARVVGVIIVVAWLTDVLELYTLNYLFSQVLTVGLLALVVLFQPELRRLVDQVCNLKLHHFWGSEKPQQEMVPVITQTVRACEIMSRERVGALIVFGRENPLDEYFKTGTMIEGRVSEQLIRNIFFPKASLHDGAMIVRNGMIAAAGCVLPLSESDRLSLDLGTRHRAAVGVSEVSDAVVVIVSEETGAISVAVGGILKRHLAPQTLERLLRNELCPEEAPVQENLAVKLYQKLQKKEKGGQENPAIKLYQKLQNKIKGGQDNEE